MTGKTEPKDSFKHVQKLVKEGKISDHGAAFAVAVGAKPGEPTAPTRSDKFIEPSMQPPEIRQRLSVIGLTENQLDEAMKVVADARLSLRQYWEKKLDRVAATKTPVVYGDDSPIKVQLFTMGRIIREVCGKELGEKLLDKLDQLEQEIHAAIQAQLDEAVATVTKTSMPTVANIEGLLRDFASEFAEPYQYMDADHTPSSQMPMARKKVTDKYAHRLKVWREVGLDEAVRVKLLAVLKSLPRSEWDGHKYCVTWESVDDLITKLELATQSKPAEGDKNE